jgi:hypothetical protein
MGPVTLHCGIESLALETETAISLLPTREQEYIRFQVVHNVRQLYKLFNPSKPNQTKQYNSMQAKKEFKSISKIIKKLELHNAIILKADKGKTIVIEYADQYYNKIQDFISSNELKIVSKDPTSRFQNKIRMVVKECKSSIPKENRSKYINLNPSAPTIRGLMKVHKNHCPIRPVINWTNAPAYKLARLLNEILTMHIPLPYIYNVKNTIQLMEDITEIPYNHNLKLASLDIDNMYPNIPTDELCSIIKRMCFAQILDEETTNELLRITQTIIEQNYFEFRNNSHTQQKGLAMGAPSSSILSEVFLQYLESTQIIDVLTNNNIRGYFRYVDDILIIYNDDITDIDKVHGEFNNLAPTIKFSIEKEHNNKIDFLDITINKETEKFKYSIFRKPTTTDVIIPDDSCHPPEQKHAAIRYMLNRMNTYYLDDDNKRTELNTIKQIATNNGYKASVIEQLSKHKTKQTTNDNNKNLWAKFTYLGKHTKFITKLFKDTPVKFAFTNNNSIQRHFSVKPSILPRTKQYGKSGIYQLTCPDCYKKYTGQTGRSFKNDTKNTFRITNSIEVDLNTLRTFWKITIP